MAIRLGARPARGLHRRRSHPMSEINVTPMVDVMLVLLHLHDTAPLLTVGAPSTCRRRGRHQQRSGRASRHLDRQGERNLPSTRRSSWRAWGGDWKQSPPTSRIPRLRVRGDQAIAYGRIMEVMAMVKALAGSPRWRWIAELPRDGAQRRAGDAARMIFSSLLTS
jgi:biopolymer transport protein TolR